MAPTAKDPEVTLVCMAPTSEGLRVFTLGRSPWMPDLMDQAGEEKLQAGILNKPTKTRMLGLKNTGGLARRPGGEDHKLTRLLT